jgi:predicted nucleic acid-binding Zn ribbon protein
MTSNKKMGRGFLQKRLKVMWKELMGQNIHSYTKGIYLSKDTLFINITSSPLRQELSMSTEKIKNLINEKMGSEVVEKVVIR